MIEQMMTRMESEVLHFEISIQPPGTPMCVGQTRRLPWEYVKQYHQGPPLRIPPWRRPEPPPPPPKA
jgi:hypothetical protein